MGCRFKILEIHMVDSWYDEREKFVGKVFSGKVSDGIVVPGYNFCQGHMEGNIGKYNFRTFAAAKVQILNA